MTLAALVDTHGADAYPLIKQQLSEPWAPLRDTWGTDPAAQAGHRRMMALAGGPAPPRKPRPSSPEVPASA